MAFVVQENNLFSQGFFHGDPHGFSPLNLSALQGRSLHLRLVHVKLMKSQRNIFHTSCCVLAAESYMLLVKDLLHLFKGEEWGWRESPFHYLIYLPNIKLK